MVQSDKSTANDLLDGNKKEVVLALEGRLFQIDDQLKKHTAHQKAENSRLQQQITQLKGDKTTINEELLKLRESIDDLQVHVGTDDEGKKN